MGTVVCVLQEVTYGMFTFVDSPLFTGSFVDMVTAGRTVPDTGQPLSLIHI